jgi:hypothetical protein
MSTNSVEKGQRKCLSILHLSLITAAVAMNEIKGGEKRNSGGCNLIKF